MINKVAANTSKSNSSSFWILPSFLLLTILGTTAALSVSTTTSKPKTIMTKATQQLSSIEDDVLTRWGWMDIIVEQQQQQQQKSSSILCLPKRSKMTSVAQREPSFWSKQKRRLTVFQVAFRIFIDYKITQRKAKKLEQKLRKQDVNNKNDDNTMIDYDNHPEMIEFWDTVHERNANLLLQKIKQLEGFWVKVGQYLSSRGDVMPSQYLNALSELQDNMPSRNLYETWLTLSEELSGEEIQQFIHVDPQPLSTASLAQVHRATIRIPSKEDDDERTTEQDVVLKIQHRGVSTLMKQDMENLRVILKSLAYMDKDFDFEPVVKEYNLEVRKELDFRTEATNMEEIRTLLEKYQDQFPVIIPQIISDLVKEKVLVMEFCQGFPIRDIQKMEEYNVNREVLLERVCTAWAVQMHVAGVFNADPHMGNILVSTASNNVDSSVPVLLDFGLTKRLDPQIKLAFARLMHSSHETDVDGLLQSFEEMGLKMNRHDPFEDMANMQRGFGTTTPQSKAKEVSKQKSKDYQRRMEAQRAEAGVEKGQKLRSPVDAWPSELIFFGRVTNMLRGLCSRLDVSYPYLRTMAMAARETLLEDVPREEHAIDLFHPSTADTIETPLQRRLKETIQQLDADGHIVGLQISVLKNGVPLANLAAGKIGTANPRPVTPNTLFNVFSVSKGVLTIGLLRLYQDGFIESLDDPVSKYWNDFGANNEEKANTTIRQVLAHQAGLANVYPEHATLDTLLDWNQMKNFIAREAQPGHTPGAETQYHALSYAWLVGGIIEAVTGKPYEEWLDQILPLRSTLTQNEEDSRTLYLAGIAPEVCNQRDLAVLSMDRRAVEQQQQQASTSRQEAGQPSSLQDTNSNSNTDNAASEEEEKEKRRKEAQKVLAKYKGLQQVRSSGENHDSVANQAAFCTTLLTTLCLFLS